IIGLSMYLPYIETVPPPALADRLKMFLNKKVTITVFITFFASISSLGLYTSLVPLIKEIANSGNLATYLCAWELDGLYGRLIIGYLIDYFKEPKTLVTIILLILMISIICIPFMMDLTFLKYVPFFVWGAMGWASQAPQQHILMSYQPSNGSSAVA